VDPTFNPEKALKEVDFNLKYVDGILSKSNYIVGEFPSLADLSAFYEIEFLMLIDYDFGKWVNLSRWMKFMKGIKEVNTANEKFYAFSDKLKKLKQPKL
jgi:glutathione S-transferase